MRKGTGKNWLKFYADTPRGERNKLFVFNIRDYEHAIDLASKFVREYHFKVRAAWYENPYGISVRFDNVHDLLIWPDVLIQTQPKRKISVILM